MNATGTAVYDHGLQCLYDSYVQHTGQEGVLYCHPLHDGINCLKFTEANTTLTLPCPPVLNAPEHIFATRTCGHDGDWTTNQTDYSACLRYLDGLNNSQSDGQTTQSPITNWTGDDTFLAEVMSDIYFITSIVSLLFLTLTLFIFCYFRSLHCNRISIHKHLVVSFIIRFIVLIAMLEPIVFQHVPFSYLVVPWLCKAMQSLSQYTLLTNMYWMFVEGLFLHNNIVVSVFSTEAPFKLFCFIGWGFPAIVTVIWTVLLQFLNDKHCWHDHSQSWIIWIVLVPFLLALVVSLYINAKHCWHDHSQSWIIWIVLVPFLLAVNLVFLINIIRVLVTKLRAKNTHESSRIKKAIKATVILLPLLGLTNLIFLWNPGGHLKIMYHVTNAVLQGMQGVFISIFYCFLNGEVQRVLRRKYRRFKILRHLRRGGRRRSSRTSSFIMSQTEVHPLTAFRNNVCNVLKGCHDDENLCNIALHSECIKLKDSNIYCTCAWPNDECDNCT